MSFQLDSKSHRRKKSTSIPWRMHLLLGGVGLIVIGIVMYSSYIGERLNTLDEPLIDAVMEIKLEAEAADFWFREAFQGNATANFEKIWLPLEQAVWYLYAILQDNKIKKNFLGPAEDNDTLELIHRVQQKLAALKNTSQKIAVAAESSGTAKGLRLQYEEAVADFFNQLDQLEGRLRNIKLKNLQHFRYLHQTLIAICFILFFSIALAFQFFANRRRKDYQILREAKQNLEIENAERLKAETGLKKAHQGLEDRVFRRTAELSQMNEKLKDEITVRRRIEKSLQESKSMLQAIFDGIPDALILVNRQMAIKMINKSAAAYYNVENYQDIVGKPCFEVAGCSDPCESCPVPGAVQNRRELMFERKGYKSPERIEQVAVHPLSGGNGNAGDAIILVSDITERRHFERRLIQSEKMASLGILVASVAHEINNPNSFISFNIPILRDYIEEMLPIIDRYAAECPNLEFCRMPYAEFRKDIFKLLDNVENGASRISSFVANLREFAASDGDRVKKYVDMKSISEKVLAMCGKKLKRSVKSVEMNIPPELPEVYTAPYAMEQVLMNLLMNAAQAACQEDSWVKLNASIGSTWREHLIIEIVDNGCGFDEKAKDRLFDPFYTTKLPGDGTGLGLYVCHNLIQAMGGRIEAESEPGKGSKFTVILPDKDNRKKPR